MNAISTIWILLLITAIVASSQSDKDHENILVLNIANAPLELINKGHTLSVKNKSKETIVSYRLGCARFEGKQIKITLRLKTEMHEMSPGTGISSASFDLLPDELIACQDLKSSLVPLEATYKNGRSWHLSKGTIKAE